MPARPALEDVLIERGALASGEALGELLEFLSTCCGDRFGEEQLMALRGEGGEVVLAVAARSSDAVLLGYGQVVRSSDRYLGELALREGETARPGLGAGIAQSMMDGVSQLGGGLLEVWSRHAGEAEDAAARQAGLGLKRRLLQLERPLPLEKAPDEPATARTRSFRVGEDEVAFLELNARAFAALPDQASWTLDALLARERQPWFDAAGFLLHEQHGALVAFCWTKLHRRAGSAVGEIYVIGVDPSAQRRRLGSAMLRAGCDYMAGRGAGAVMLYVDGANAPALALYESMGFRLDHEDHCYATEVGGR